MQQYADSGDQKAFEAGQWAGSMIVNTTIDIALIPLIYIVLKFIFKDKMQPKTRMITSGVLVLGFVFTTQVMTQFLIILTAYLALYFFGKWETWGASKQ